MHMRTGWRRLVPLAAAAALLLAACGDDDDDDATAESTATTAAAETPATSAAETPATTSAATTATTATESTAESTAEGTAPATTAAGGGGISLPESGEATGEPIKIGSNYTKDAPGSAQPEIGTAAEAAVDFLNSHGGVAGHPIELVLCDEKGDPNEATACGQKFADEVIAVVGGATTFGDQEVPFLEEANIPWIGNWVRAPIDTGSPMTFPIFAPNAVAFIGAGQRVAEQGATSVRVAHVDNASAAGLAQLVGLGAEAGGATYAGAVPIAADAANFDAPAATLTSDSDGAVIINNAEQTPQILNALNRAGTDFTTYHVAMSSGSLPQDAIDSLESETPGLTEGIEFVDPTPGANDPVNADVVQILQAYDPDIRVSSHAINTMYAFLVFADVMKDAATVDSASILDAFNKLEGYTLGPISLTTTGGVSIAGYDDVDSTLVYVTTVEGGKPTPNGTLTVKVE
jgi:ABC-type branched-subunit amino acid transport system substrate-binding protein